MPDVSSVNSYLLMQASGRPMALHGQESSRFVFTPHFVDDAWCAGIDANKKKVIRAIILGSDTGLPRT